MPDEMFFSDDMRSLRRGRRRSRRSQAFRPCYVWPKDAPDLRFEGVVLDICPYGMLVRTIESLPAGTTVCIQLMRDESFREPLAQLHEGTVVRMAMDEGGFTDHGIALTQPEMRRVEPKPLSAGPRRPANTPQSGNRMHTIDITVGERGTRRRGKQP